MARGTLDALVVPIAEAIGELAEILGVDDGADLIARLGYRLPAGSDLPNLFDDVLTSATALGTSLNAVIDAYVDGSYTEPSFLKKVLDLITVVVKAVKTFDGLPQRAQAAIPDAAFLQNAKIDQLPFRLVDFLIVTYLRRKHPKVESLFTILGIVTQNTVAEGDYNPVYDKIEVRWDRIPKWFTDPGAVLAEEYGWHRDPFQAEILLERINAFMWLSGVFGLVLPLPDSIDAEAPAGTQLDVPLFAGTVSVPADGLAGVLAGLWGRRHDDPADVTNSGLAIEPYVDGSFDAAIELGAGWNLVVGADLAAQGLALLIQPSGLSIALVGAASAGVSLGVLRNGDILGALVLLGNAGGSRLDINMLALTIGAEISPPHPLEAFVEMQLDGTHIVVKPEPNEADSFLGSLLGPEGISAEMSFSVRLSSRTGLSFKGSGGLEASFPLHVNLGPIEFQGLTLGLKPTGQNVGVEVGTTIAGNLGPLAFVVERAGLKLILQFPDLDDGKPGGLNLGLGFKPPNGVGLSIDASVVKGGGYLYFDYDRGEYAGVLELVIQDFLTLTAIGLISTKMPDGSEGFSLLIIITVEFATGIQLGYGFKLIGVGGLLGLNRAMRLQPLIEGVRTGAINGIMFPRDVIANAPRIISDFRTIFPPEQGKFLIGPMIKLAWGTPTLISLSVGIIIEIPGNIAIVGVLRAILPTEDEIVLVLQVSFAGVIEFDKKRVYFFASIFESRILTMTIEGEMGVLLAFGEDANFVLSVGGFHPHFNPPPLPFPNPVRVSINILNEESARIRVMAYFAITSNTAQFGAHAELYFGYEGVIVQGHIGFDVLIQFSPFYLIAEVSASVSLKVAGIDALTIRLQFMLEGPTPWRAHGSGHIKLLFFEVSASFDVTWGEERDTTLPPIEVIPLLKVEFEKVENWRALLPETNNLLVTLRPLEGTGEALVLHPAGTLQVSQKAVPLDLTIDKVGNQKPSDAKNFKLAVTSSGFGQADILEQFAIAQYQEMDDASKLSKPAYQRMHGGIKASIAGQELNSSKVVKRVVRYEQIIIDTKYKRTVQHFAMFIGSLFNHFLNGASVTKSPLSQHLQQQKVPFNDKIKVTEEGHTVVFQSNNTAINNTATFPSQAMANEYMNQVIAEDPKRADALHVIPQSEVVR